MERQDKGPHVAEKKSRLLLLFFPPFISGCVASPAIGVQGLGQRIACELQAVLNAYLK
jgi:hypothetical protein